MIKKLVFGIVLVLLFNSCHVGRFFIYNFADIRDHKKFPHKKLTASSTPFHFTETVNSNLKLPKELIYKKKSHEFEAAVKKNGTVALMIIRNDSVLYQWYRPNYDQSSIIPSFSMSKSVISALIGIAIDEGKIKSSNEPITNYLEFKNKGFEKITIQHLLDMRSGIHFNENYFNPFGDVAKHYYGIHLKKYITNLKVKEEPGKTFEYISVNTQVLALIIEKATGKNVTEYLQEKIWSQIGMEFDASWSIDSKKNKTEKAFCCINARTKDYAKFGRLYLNKGNWNGKQIISEKWINESVHFTDNKNSFLYSNQWWHTRETKAFIDSANLKPPYIVYSVKNKVGNMAKYVTRPSGDYFANGLLGQYIYVYPEKNLIIVRLGKKEGKINWPQLFRNIAKSN